MHLTTKYKDLFRHLSACKAFVLVPHWAVRWEGEKSQIQSLHLPMKILHPPPTPSSAWIVAKYIGKGQRFFNQPSSESIWYNIKSSPLDALPNQNGRFLKSSKQPLTPSLHFSPVSLKQTLIFFGGGDWNKDWYILFSEMPLASKVFVWKTLLVLQKPHLKYSTDYCLPGDWYLLRGVGVNCGQTVSVAPPRGKASILPLSHSLVCDAHASMWSSQCLCVVFDAARMHNSCVRLLCVAFSGTALCLCHTTHATGCWVFVSIINL